MAGRPRIDLDGVALADAAAGPDDDAMVLAIFRYRTTDGLILLMPESGEFLVPWSAVASADVDLASGGVTIRLEESYAAGKGWLRGATALTGAWIDRMRMEATSLIG